MHVIARRRGLTLIELLVVIALIGVLIALLLPAIQAAREAGRRMQCVSNLKMLGLAIHEHTEAQGTFPGGNGRPLDASYLVQVLPYLEQTPLYNSINFTNSVDTIVTNDNRTALLTRISSFLCPSEPSRDLGVLRLAPNYAANAGPESIRGTGVFIGQTLGPRDITDGLSQTAGLSEWIVGTAAYEQGSRLGSVYTFAESFALTDRRRFAQLCDSLVPNHAQLTSLTSKGLIWTTGGLGMTQYNHTLPPNYPSCDVSPFHAYTAGSFHYGGVNLLLMDGSVRFVKQSIDPDVWAAVGTRSGGEIIGGDAF